MKLSLFYPVSPVHFNQAFGGNAAYYQANGINIKGHNGLDLMAFHGQPVYAAQAGMAYYEKDSAAGHGVVIVGSQKCDFEGKQVYFKTIYWHLCDPGVEPKYASPIFTAVGGFNTGNGVPVKVGDLIGFADSTGLSTGDHLHFGLKPIVAGPGVRSGDAPDVAIGDWLNVVPDNGYLGAIDPLPYFNGYFAPQAYQLLSLMQKTVALLQLYLLKLQNSHGN